MRRIIAHGVSLGIFPVGLHSIVKVVLAMLLIVASSVANAVTVVILVHNQTSSSGTISSLITTGAHTSGLVGPSAVTWDWDGTTLDATGLYTAVSSLGSSIYASTILGDEITDLNIDTGTTSAGGSTAYNCVEGSFLAGVGAHGCGNYTLGGNFGDDSTTVWSGLTVSQTIAGDDVSTGAPRTISSYDFGVVTLLSGASTTEPGAIFSIGNTIHLGTPSGEAMQFAVPGEAVPDGPFKVAASATINIPILDNDTVFDDIADLTATVPSQGTAVVVDVDDPLPSPQAGLSIDYTSPVGFDGTATFDYTVTDRVGVPLTATVTVTNQLPVARDDVDGTKVGVSVDVDVLDNDDLGDGPTVTVEVLPINEPAFGTVVVTGSPDVQPGTNITVTYTPDPGHIGDDTFTYTLTDDNGDTVTALVMVTTTDKVVAIPDSETTDKNISVDIDVLDNDVGLAFPDFTVAMTAGPSKGVVTTTLPVTCTLPADCALTYQPNAGQVGTDTFIYEVTDTDVPPITSAALVTIFINDLPVAVADSLTALTATDTPLDVQANDLGLADSPIVVTVTSSPAFGTAIPDGGDPEMVTYTSNVGYVGPDSFTYELLDSNGDTSNVVTVTLDVDDEPVANDNGTAGAPGFMVDKSMTGNFDVLANDTGLSNVPLTVAIIAPLPALGAATVIANPPFDKDSIHIDYAAGPVPGTDLFVYEITDLSGDTSSATAWVEVVDPNIPVANDVQDTTDVDQTVLTNVLANDMGLADVPLVVTIFSDPDNGTIGPITDCDGLPGSVCQVTYIPDPGFVGIDTYQYKVTDSTPDSDTATVTITVNDLPVAEDDADTTLADTLVDVDVLANDTGLNDTPLTVTITSNPTNGTVGAITDCDGLPGSVCKVSYTPRSGFVGTDTFQYRITDITPDNSNIATVTITVNPQPIVNDKPRAVFDEDTTFGGVTIPINVLANDTGLSDVPLMVEIVAQPGNGSIGQITACDGLPGSVCQVPYTPNAGFSGADSFQYKVTDSTQDSSTATVVINVTEAPIANPDEGETTISKSVTIDVLANDTGLANTPLTVSITGDANPQKGLAEAKDGKVVYTSTGTEETTDTFRYTVTDDNDQSSEATVTVTVNAEDSSSSQFKKSSSAVGPIGLGLMLLLPWLRRRYRRR